ncbi:MAG: NADH-quinone oxidoreductase subunit B family protein [bacterium]|nr:NADH-quinone oxidoreductase subunit B family protein [bacterium]
MSWALKKSIWVFHVSSGSCNNCDIEILDALTPRYDLERFGIRLVGSARHADVLLVVGALNLKAKERVLRIYEQTPKPCLVIAVGSCACSGGIFCGSYNIVGPYDKYLPVAAYIPGCPPKPEAIIMGIVKVLSKL